MNRIEGLSVAELVEGLDGVSVIGDSTVICIDALPLCDACDGCVTLVDDISRSDVLAKSRAAAVVTIRLIPDARCTQIVCDDLHRVFTAIVKRYRHATSAIIHSAIDATAQIDPTATIGIGSRIDSSVVIGADVIIGRDCHLMPGVVVMEGTRIGDNCTLFPRVVLYDHTRIDNDVQIHAGCVIGAHGFGYRQVKGRHVPTAQLGYVHIESFVEIGANVTIDRGTYGVTRIGEGTKIDNLVMIAHNCHIGRHNLICSQVGIAGSCSTGDYVVLAGQVGLADHVTIGDHAIISAQSGVMENLQGQQTYFGSPATSQREQMQMIAVQRRLPEMRRELRSVRRDLETVTTAVKNMTHSHESAEPNCDLQTDADDDAGDQPRCLAFKRPAA